MKQALFIGAIASILTINSVLADTTSTVTSRGYVDAAVATKQNKIDATGANFTNGSVVETTGTDGVVTQRGIFNYDTDYDWDNHTVEQGHEDDLVTAESVMPQLDYLSGVYQIDKYCVEYVENATNTDENCLLWNIGDNIMGPYRRCQTNSDCGGCESCFNHLCKDDGSCDQ